MKTSSQRSESHSTRRIPRRCRWPHSNRSHFTCMRSTRRGLSGGLVGRTHAIAQWLEVSVVWVDEQARGQGMGRWLMAEAEREAIGRGCQFARLATSNFQAPGFYEKLGYALYGRLENCPPGETIFYFWKALDATHN
ncbi:MAG TPA: GNAT family N-acetyltransferase [Ktedonobacterales bacterium]|nr:GNAT family N-acetyltransferase [Ktedonobacterales bacterium]